MAVLTGRIQRPKNNIPVTGGWQNLYPRPQLKRDKYLLLADGWSLNGLPIIIPYPPESTMSKYLGEVGDELIYECAFRIPENFTDERILINFGAVDQIAEVWINDEFAGKHVGGYMPFTFDITSFVRREGLNNLKVKATDTLSTDYPYGKQSKRSKGMWYTCVSGIWQTVWLENVPNLYIKDIKINADLEGTDISINTNIENHKGFKAEVELPDGRIAKYEFENNSGRLDIDNPIFWSVENPHLYPIKIFYGEDKVESYFALRTVEIKKFDNVNRVCHNGRPVFWHGVLNQGYFSEGLYTPKNPQEYEREILNIKSLGFNMMRVHLKIQPDIFYYYCDKHGMLVMQDMVNSGKYLFIGDTVLPTLGIKHRGDKSGRKGKRKEFFTEHVKQTVRHLYNHPCVVAYTIFNEGWGQFESDYIYDLIKKMDPARLINSTSGWYHQEKSDFDSEHIYNKTVAPEPKERPLLISECGGYSCEIEGHCDSVHKAYGYGKARDAQDLMSRILQMYGKMVLPAIKKGLCGCIYTQLSDIENEINGLFTYDRQVCKVDSQAFQQLSKQLHEELE